MSNPSPWIKAQKSSNDNACVEMRKNGESIEVRDSKHPDGAVHQYTKAEFSAWLDGAKKGEFDHLA